MLNRIESEHCAFDSRSSDCEEGSAEEAENELQQELQNKKPLDQIEEEEEPLKQFSDTSDSGSESFRTIDQACLLTFCHFCEESDSDENPGIVNKLRKLIQYRNKEESAGPKSRLG